LTAIRRKQFANWLRWAALLLLIAATPYCWLVVRDTILVLHASDGQGEETARWLLVTRFANTIDDSKISAKTREPFYLTMLYDPSCFVLKGATLLPSDTPPAQSSLREDRQPSLDEILSTHRMLAERQVNQTIQDHAISESFSTAELILFNGCVAATPFAPMCEKRVSARLDAVYDKVSEEAFTLLGTKARQAGAPNRYCDIMPQVVMGERPKLP